MSHNIIICVWILGPCCLLVPTELFCLGQKKHFPESEKTKLKNAEIFMRKAEDNNLNRAELDLSREAHPPINIITQ